MEKPLLQVFCQLFASKTDTELEPSDIAPLFDVFNGCSLVNK